MANSLFLICPIIAGIILGIIIYKKLPKRLKRLFVPIHIAIIIISITLMRQLNPDMGGAMSLLFFVSLVLFIISTVSLAVELILFIINKIINKIKNKKIFQAISIVIISLLTIILIRSIFSITSIIATPSSYGKEYKYNSVKNWFRCKIRFGDWITHNSGLYKTYECGFERTSDGGKWCTTSDECELDCVFAHSIYDDMHRICQTHKRFLDMDME